MRPFSTRRTSLLALILVTGALVGTFAFSRAVPASAATAGYLTYTSAQGGWSVEYPDSWRTATWRVLGASFTSYDPNTAVWEKQFGSAARAGTPPQTEMRVDIEVWPNDKKLTAPAYADEFLNAPPTVSHAQVISRQNVTVSGRGAVLATLSEETPAGSRSAIYVFVASASQDRLYLIRAFPLDSVQRTRFDHMVVTFSAR